MEQWGKVYEEKRRELIGRARQLRLELQLVDHSIAVITELADYLTPEAINILSDRLHDVLEQMEEAL